MTGTRFVGSSLKEVNFVRTDLSKALFENTDLHGAVFNQTQLKEANLLSAFNFYIDPEINDIHKAKLSTQGALSLLSKYDLRIE